MAAHQSSELSLAKQRALTSEPVEANARFRSTHLEVEEETGKGIADSLLHLAGLHEQDAELTTGEGHAGPVSQLLCDREGALVLPAGLLVVALGLGQHAQLVVARSH